MWDCGCRALTDGCFSRYWLASSERLCGERHSRGWGRRSLLIALEALVDSICQSTRDLNRIEVVGTPIAKARYRFPTLAQLTT